MALERLQEDGQYQYRLVPGEYPISDNNRPATYDQFMSLRDTLVFSKKYYADNAGRSLIIGTKLSGEATGTIEIWQPNISRQAFEPSGNVEYVNKGQYVTSGEHIATNPLSCEINKNGRYALEHKEQFNGIDPSITRIHAYIVQHRMSLEIERAVFDWEWDTPGEMKRITSYGYVECDLKKGDWLELRVRDQNDRDITSEMANNSNWWTVEYLDLAYNI